MLSDMDALCFAILEQAAVSPFGVVIKTNSPIRARAAIYEVRKITGDSRFTELQIRVSPDDAEGEIWLLHSAKRPKATLPVLPNSSLLG